MRCPKGHEDVKLLEYGFGPYRYDGISEIICNPCNKRYGRWSGKVLKEGEQEPPYGNVKYITNETRIYNL